MILVLGDPHLDTPENGGIEAVNNILNQIEPTHILCTGDLERYMNFPHPIFFVSGNHENFKELEEIARGTLKYENLQLIANCKPLVLEGRKVAGLSGIYSEDYYQEPYKKRDFVYFCRPDVESCQRLRHIDIFLSHEAPSGIGFVRRGKDLGNEQIRSILNHVKPSHHFFGHHHHYIREEIKHDDGSKTTCIGLPRPKDGYVLYDSEKNVSHNMFT